MPPLPRLPLLIGPTACGKSAVALAIARRRGAELLSVDSMKLYRGLDIGVAKPTPDEQAAVRHHGIDRYEPWEHGSVADWLREAESLVRDAHSTNRPLIAEGGTSMYIKALREGLFDGPGRDDAVRAKLEARADGEGLDVLFARLKEVDPAAGERILPNDRRRIVRALEVYELTGRPISDQQAQWGELRDDLAVPTVALTRDREALYRRIDARIDAMLDAGWLDECRRLLALEKPLSREATQALGYRTLFAHLRGEMELEAARQRICYDTHHFARRQLSWFRKFPAVTWIDINEDESVTAVADRVEAAWADAAS